MDGDLHPLWDIAEGERTHVPAGKFHAIILEVTEQVQLDGTAKLTFEVSDGVRPMQLYCAAMPILRGGAVRGDLSPRPASRKARDRWLGEESRKAAACCGPSATGSGCCT